MPDVAHHDVDEGVLDEAQEHEDGAGGHKHVYSLHQKSQIKGVACTKSQKLKRKPAPKVTMKGTVM